jgi:predicted nucleic acid-binding protein
MRGIQAFFPPARKEQAVSDNPSRLLLDEYKEVLNRLRVRAAHTGNLIASLRRGGVLVQPWYSVEISPDPADDIFFAAAIAGKAKAIITSNPKHFPPVNGIRILSPNDALKEIP